MDAYALAKRALANPAEAFRITEGGATVTYNGKGYFWGELEVFYSRSGLTPTSDAANPFEVADEATALLANSMYG